jgi:type II secretion system protein C
MAKQKIKKRTAFRITPEIEARIVELSLQHPDFGAKRLLPLLSSENIDVSASTVYNILKRSGLSSREKRLSKLAEQSRRKRRPPAKKKSARITNEAAERIVQVSLQNPDYGARRLLTLLAEEKIRIPVSTVNSVLRRHGLQNRDRRLARVKAQEPVATPPPKGVEISPPQAVQAPTPAERPAPISERIVEKVKPSRNLLIPSITQRAVTGRPWFITVINSVLICLIVLLGFHTWHNVSQARLAPDTAALIPHAKESVAPNPEALPAPVSDFRLISKRNLFNAAKSIEPTSPKAIPVEKLVPAQKELGLKLVGTVVAYDSRLSRAFIDNRRTSKQEVYGEGDKVGDARIKKVLRNRVIIATKEGDRLLTVRIAASGNSNQTYSAGPEVSRASMPRSQSPGRPLNSARVRHISLNRQEVENSLANVDQVLQELTLTPYMRFQKPAGFRISNLSADSIFKKMGLSSWDVIVGINDQTITSPDQAADFLQTLAEADEVTIKARRRLRTRRIILSIQ